MVELYIQQCFQCEIFSSVVACLNTRLRARPFPSKVLTLVSLAGNPVSYVQERMAFIVFLVINLLLEWN